MLEKRQQQIRELKDKQERLQVELQEAKSRLMLHPSKWSGDCELLRLYQLTHFLYEVTQTNLKLHS